jgi:periplasmic protein TonB
MTGGPAIPSAIETRVTYGARRQHERARRRELANGRAKTRIDPAVVTDPFLRVSEDRKAPLASAAYWLVVALALHGVLLLVALVVPEREQSRTALTYLEPVVVQDVEPPHIEPPPPIARPPEAQRAEPVPPVPRVIKPPVEAPAEKRTPPPDPINLAPEPTVTPPKERPRRIVGLSLESTTTGGAGEAVATGNTRMGQTSLVADDPDKVEKLQHTFVPPRRTSVYVPAYPASLRGQGIHGEVGLQVEIDQTGAVTRVSATRPSAHEEFNTLAVDAAKRCTYEPATVDGVPVARSIDITVQFQPNN